MSRTIERREQRVRAAIRTRGLLLTPIGSAGAVLIEGAGVYIRAAALRYVDEDDLEPAVQDGLVSREPQVR